MKKLFYLFIWLLLFFVSFNVNFLVFAQNDDWQNVDGWVKNKTEGLKLENTNTSEVWISLSWSCLDWMWKWCFDYEKMIWINKDQPDYTVTTIVQDVIFAATYMVWAILTLVIIWCGLGYIFASKNWGNVSNYKKWLINAAIWAVLVWWAYAIVRLIQYIAKW